MALKRKITKTDYEALPDVLKAEYKQDGDSYILDLDGGDDLTRAKEAEVQRRKDAEKALKEAQDAYDALKDDKSRRDGDIEALEASYKKKLEEAEKRATDTQAALDDERRDRYVTAEAEKIAAKFTVPGLMRKEIAARLSVEIHDGKPLVRVLDKDGKPSALSVEDLTKEFVDNPEYKGIVIAGKGTGAGGTNPLPASGGRSDLPTLPNSNATDLSKLTSKELAAHMAAKYPDEATQ